MCIQSTLVCCTHDKMITFYVFFMIIIFKRQFTHGFPSPHLLDPTLMLPRADVEGKAPITILGHDSKAHTLTIAGWWDRKSLGPNHLMEQNQNNIPNQPMKTNHNWHRVSLEYSLVSHLWLSHSLLYTQPSSLTPSTSWPPSWFPPIHLSVIRIHS